MLLPPSYPSPLPSPPQKKHTQTSTLYCSSQFHLSTQNHYQATWWHTNSFIKRKQGPRTAAAATSVCFKLHPRPLPPTIPAEEAIHTLAVLVTDLTDPNRLCLLLTHHTSHMQQGLVGGGDRPCQNNTATTAFT